ncbi:MAG: WD40 repeat domain-containing protein [Planctomycetes bacterium]|nr:WD40 repeat domain-containing protein [Planctomycetota bacterium]
MLRSLRFKTVLRLFAWTLFAAFLGFIAWSLYVILPPQPRWVIENSSLQIPFCFLKDGSGAVFIVLDEKFQQQQLGLIVRDLTDGSELSGYSAGELIETTRDGRRQLRNTLFLQCDRRLRGVRPSTGEAWDIPLPDFVLKVADVQASPEGDLLVVIPQVSDKDSHCVILNTQDGRLLGELPVESRTGPIDFTPLFLSAVLPERKAVALWDRKQLRSDREVAFPEAANGKTLKPLKVNNGDLVLQESDSEIIDLVMWDLPEISRRAELGHYPMRWTEFRFSPNGEFLVAGEQRTHNVKIWKVASRQLIAELTQFPKVGIANVQLWFSPDGRHLAAFDADNYADADDHRRLLIYDLATGVRIWERKHVSVPQCFSASAFLRDSKPFLFAPNGNTVAVETSTELQFLETTTGALRFSAPKSDENSIRACSNNGRYVLSTTLHPCEASRLERFLKEWLPASWLTWLGSEMEVSGQFIDWEKGLVQDDVIWGRVVAPNQLTMVADDGRTFFTITLERRDKSAISCWDIPAKRRWEWILGVPAALALAVIGWRPWRPWRRNQYDRP